MLWLKTAALRVLPKSCFLLGSDIMVRGGLSYWAFPDLGFPALRRGQRGAAWLGPGALLQGAPTRCTAALPS